VLCLWCSFKGVFVCPRAESFCQLETITGIWQPEFQRWQFYLMLAVFPGLPCFLALLCLLPCCHNTFVVKLKS
jgi:hypothetical protein